MNDWLTDWLTEWMNESINQSIIQSLKEWINESLNESMNKSINQWKVARMKSFDSGTVTHCQCNKRLWPYMVYSLLYILFLLYFGIFQPILLYIGIFQPICLKFGMESLNGMTQHVYVIQMHSSMPTGQTGLPPN